MLCLASTTADDPNSVLLCDECDGDAHLECTGLAAVPGAEAPASRAPFARGGRVGGGRRGGRVAAPIGGRRRRSPIKKGWIEENRPPADASARRSRSGFWPFVVKPDGDLTRVAAALEVAGAPAARGDQAPHPGRLPQAPDSLQMGRHVRRGARFSGKPDGSAERTT